MMKIINRAIVIFKRTYAISDWMEKIEKTLPYLSCDMQNVNAEKLTL